MPMTFLSRIKIGTPSSCVAFQSRINPELREGGREAERCGYQVRFCDLTVVGPFRITVCKAERVSGVERKPARQGKCFAL